MHPLVILCEPHFVPLIKQGLDRYAHPRLLNDFVSIIEVDVNGHVDVDNIHFRILEKTRQQAWPPRASGIPYVAATDAVFGAARLKKHFSDRGVELLKLVSREIGKLDKPDMHPPPQLLRVLGKCDLSVNSAAATLLAPWNHHRVDLNAVTAWQSQFAELGKEFLWIGQFLLREIVMMDPVDLTDRLMTMPAGAGIAGCYNKDERGTPKSGEFVAGLLHKRNPTAALYDAPAAAFDAGGHSKIVVFEDGLWTGTEAIGILESLQGHRKGTGKTKALSDVKQLENCDLIFAYAIATDYGLALMNRYAKQKKLHRVSFWGASEVRVAAPGVIDRLADPNYDASGLFAAARPEDGSLRPYLVERARERMGDDRAEKLRAFCWTVGRQLWEHYLAYQVKTNGWDLARWPEERRSLAALGMHSMGLTHAFAHSVPKATSPLLWGRGPVTVAGRTVDWKPLFPNS